MEPQEGIEQKATCWPHSWNYYVRKKLPVILIDQDLKLFVMTVCLPYQSTNPNDLQDIMIQCMQRMVWEYQKEVVHLGWRLYIRKGSPEEETLKMNLEGQCETVRKEI